jgi:hypothetical protein
VSPGGPPALSPIEPPYLIRGIDCIGWEAWKKASLLTVPASPAHFTPKSRCEWPGSEIEGNGGGDDVFGGVRNNREDGAAEAGERDRRRTTARGAKSDTGGSQSIRVEPPRWAPRALEWETEQEQEQEQEQRNRERNSHVSSLRVCAK